MVAKQLAIQSSGGGGLVCLYCSNAIIGAADQQNGGEASLPAAAFWQYNYRHRWPSGRSLSDPSENRGARARAPPGARRAPTVNVLTQEAVEVPAVCLYHVSAGEKHARDTRLQALGAPGKASARMSWRGGAPGAERSARAGKSWRARGGRAREDLGARGRRLARAGRRLARETMRASASV